MLKTKTKTKTTKKESATKADASLEKIERAGDALTWPPRRHPPSPKPKAKRVQKDKPTRSKDDVLWNMQFQIVDALARCAVLERTLEQVALLITNAKLGTTMHAGVWK